MSTNLNKKKSDSFFMNLALRQAYLNIGNTKENPSVGCIITKNNTLIACGATSINGRPHAETNSILSSVKNLKNSNLYVTLEPCSHYGKTPPCTNIIIKKKIKKVFFSINDPDSRSRNKSYSILKKRGIFVRKGLLKNDANFLYRSYIKFKNKQLPFVTCKMAISKDCYTIDKNNKWITNQYSRGRVHLLRSFHDCIMTSSKTIIKDNPKLDCRIYGLEDRTPILAIIDNKLSIPMSSYTVNNAARRKTIIFYNKKNINKIKLLKKQKIRLFRVPLNNFGNIDLKSCLVRLKKLGLSRIFLETGLKLTSSFIKENLVDDFKIFISNKNCGKKGQNNFKKHYKFLLGRKNVKNEKVNLFGDKLISVKIK
tara:strand:+ start:963 stop:2066 length:1104 start_codon:yes stop_codon:yes gene_type:complete